MRIKKTLETFINMLGFLQETYLFIFCEAILQICMRASLIPHTSDKPSRGLLVDTILFHDALLSMHKIGPGEQARG